MSEPTPREEKLNPAVTAALSAPQAIHYKNGGVLYNKAYVDMIKAEQDSLIQGAFLTTINQLDADFNDAHISSIITQLKQRYGGKEQENE